MNTEDFTAERLKSNNKVYLFRQNTYGGPFMQNIIHWKKHDSLNIIYKHNAQKSVTKTASPHGVQHAGACEVLATSCPAKIV